MAKRRRLAVEVPLGISPEGDDTRGRMEPRDREPNPEQVTVNAQLFQILAVRLRKVSPELQALVYLRYFEEVPVANTARKLGISPAAVKSRCHRVLSSFKPL